MSFNTFELTYFHINNNVHVDQINSIDKLSIIVKEISKCKIVKGKSMYITFQNKKLFLC